MRVPLCGHGFVKLIVYNAGTGYIVPIVLALPLAVCCYVFNVIIAYSMIDLTPSYV